MYSMKFSLIITFILITLCDRGLVQKNDNVNSNPDPITIKNNGKMTINLQLLQRTKDILELEIRIYNGNKDSVYLTTNPVRANGSQGWYVTVDENDPSVLVISSRLYNLPPYDLTINKSSVLLKLLLPGDNYKEIITIKIPTQESMPPYGTEMKRGLINSEKIKYIKAVVGMISEDEGVKDILTYKSEGSFISGAEMIMRGSFKGENLINLQTLLLSKQVSF
jgi:hypothetical protein